MLQFHQGLWVNRKKFIGVFFTNSVGSFVVMGMFLTRFDTTFIKQSFNWSAVSFGFEVSEPSDKIKVPFGSQSLGLHFKSSLISCHDFLHYL